jgi:hypothetical protein
MNQENPPMKTTIPAMQNTESSGAYVKILSKSTQNFASVRGPEGGTAAAGEPRPIASMYDRMISPPEGMGHNER